MPISGCNVSGRRPGLEALRIVSSYSMGTKRCSQCGKRKDIEQFSLRGEGKRHAHCKGCQREYNKEHYKRNRSLHIARAVKRKIATRLNQCEKIAAIKSSTPCADCGEQYPHYVMDFDHVRGKKLKDVADMPGGYGWAKIEKEIAKCDVVCSNCHRQRTWERKQDMV